MEGHLKSPSPISILLILLSLLAHFTNCDRKDVPQNVGPATPGANLTEDCNRIHESLQMFFITSLKPTVTAYRVRLKRFTTHKDTLETLARPAMADVTPMAIFDKDKHRGFTATLSKNQVCELYHLPTVSRTFCTFPPNLMQVSNISPCRTANSTHPRCEPSDYMLFWVLSMPGNLNTIKVTADTRGLTPDCAATVKQIFTNVTQRGYVSGRYFAGIKSFVTRAEAERLVYSPGMNGTSFVRHEEKMWANNETKTYEGRWNLTQVCSLERRPEVHCSIFECRLT